MSNKVSAIIPILGTKGQRFSAFSIANDINAGNRAREYRVSNLPNFMPQQLQVHSLKRPFLPRHDSLDVLADLLGRPYGIPGHALTYFHFHHRYMRSSDEKELARYISRKVRSQVNHHG